MAQGLIHFVQFLRQFDAPRPDAQIGLGFRVLSKVAQQGDVSFHKGTSGFRLGPGRGPCGLGFGIGLRSG